jgi:hypothetical protein
LTRQLPLALTSLGIGTTTVIAGLIVLLGFLITCRQRRAPR